MDAVTGLSGSGPAYFFLIIEALIEAGLKTGLSRSLAKQLATQTMLGAARLCLHSDKEPAAIKGNGNIAGWHYRRRIEGDGRKKHPRNISLPPLKRQRIDLRN